MYIPLFIYKHHQKRHTRTQKKNVTLENIPILLTFARYYGKYCQLVNNKHPKLIKFP